MDEDLPCYMEQSDGQSDPFTHEEHQQQQDHLEPKDLVQEQESTFSTRPAPFPTVKTVAATA